MLCPTLPWLSEADREGPLEVRTLGVLIAMLAAAMLLLSCVLPTRAAPGEPAVPVRASSPH
jgi:hypothetical protein